MAVTPSPGSSSTIGVKTAIATALGVILIVVLQALGVLHALWGFGVFWPAPDEATLVAHVIGRTPNMSMPGWIACFFVAFCLFEVAAMVFIRLRHISTRPFYAKLVRSILWLAAAVFVARGVAGYVPAVFAYAEGTPFHSLNLTVYSPLCLALGVGLMLFDTIAPLATERA